METVFGILVLSMAAGAVFSLIFKKPGKSGSAVSRSVDAATDDFEGLDPEREKAIDEVIANSSERRGQR